MLSQPYYLDRDFVQVANLSGFAISGSDVEHEVLAAPHQPRSLPRDKDAVYVFSLAPAGGTVLKVGRTGCR